MAVLAQARAKSPADTSLRSAELRQREWTVSQLAVQAELARSSGQLATAQALLVRAQAVDALHPRVQALAEQLARVQRADQLLQRARQAESAQRLDEAAALAQRALSEGAPAAEAGALLARVHQALAGAHEAPVLGAAFRKPLNVEFRDAPLRSIFEGLSRTHGINFVFDREVRADARLSITLRDVTLAEALRILLTTQQLASKVLGESTLLIYANTPAKQREHQDLVTRSFFLVNAEAKQVQTLIRTMAKTRDLYVDERLNQVMVRDTPEVVALVARLVAAVDLPEPEVVLEVEVLEIATTQLDSAGIQWPEELQFGLPGAGGLVELGTNRSFRASIANPALVATLRGSNGRVNTLANPRLRARNREKAKVLVGEKLPVFTTTSTANVGVSASVSYLDVGLKLEVEPSVQLDNDVVMKVSLEVSTLIGRVAGPQGSVGYQVGTRQASTSLRLRDGETQILAGLIRDEDSKSVSGIPGAAEMPVLGRLFGVHTDQRNKTEIVLLITPRVVRNVQPPPAATANAPAGVDASPGAPALRLAGRGSVAVPLGLPGRTGPAGGARAAAAAAAAVEPPADAPGSPAQERDVALHLATSGTADVGGTAMVTLHNRSDATVTGELVFETTALQSAQTSDPRDARVSFSLQPGAERAFPFRVLAAAAGQSLNVQVGGVQAVDASGVERPVQVHGSGTITVAKP